MTDSALEERDNTHDDMEEIPNDLAPEAAPPKKRRWKWVVAVVIIVLGAMVMLPWRSPPKLEAKVAPDVPHIDGKMVVFSPTFAKRAEIEFEGVHSQTLVPRIRVVGTVDFDPNHVAAVGTRIQGLVRKLHKFEGDAVKKDDVLAEIESAELGEAQAAVNVADAHRQAAAVNEKREIDLATRGLTTAREREVATATHREQRALLTAAVQRVKALSGAPTSPFGVYLLRAPLDGTVVDRHVSAGQTVEGHLIAYQVANLDHLWVDLDVFESNLEAIRKDDPVELRRVGHENDPIVGRIAHVGEVVDPITRTAKLRVAVANEERHLRPGQSVTAMIRASGPARTMLAVPQTAITYIDGDPMVFIAEGEDRVAPTPVVLGPSDGKLQGIQSGLTEGQRVVSKGVFALKSELYR